MQEEEKQQGLRRSLKARHMNMIAIGGTKALVAAIVAGGWVAVIVIIVICLVALMCSSIFGIFFNDRLRGNGCLPACKRLF